MERFPFTPGSARQVDPAAEAERLAEARKPRKGRVLTTADPEPPPGTVVRDATGCEWYRSDEGGYWLRRGRWDLADPESWVKIAGNYGPVTVLEWGGLDG